MDIVEMQGALALSAAFNVTGEPVVLVLHRMEMPQPQRDLSVVLESCLISVSQGHLSHTLAHVKEDGSDDAKKWRCRPAMPCS